MSKLINLYEGVEVGDIVLYPTCEVCKRFKTWKGLDMYVTYTRGNPYAFSWKVCSINREEKKVMLKPYRVPYYFNFLNNDDIKEKIKTISSCPEDPIVIPINNSLNKKYAIIYDRDYAERILISKKDKLENKISPIVLLRNDLMAVEKYVSKMSTSNGENKLQKIWQIFPTQITNINAIKKCDVNFEPYLEQANRLKVISILEALTERTDKEDIKKYILLLKKTNPEIIDIIMELSKDNKKTRILNKIFEALLF